MILKLMEVMIFLHFLLLEIQSVLEHAELSSGKTNLFAC